VTDVAVDVCVVYTNYFRFALPMAARGPGTFHARHTIFWTLTFCTSDGVNCCQFTVAFPGIFASIGIHRQARPPSVRPRARSRCPFAPCKAEQQTCSVH
jgi:hypothetical protein